MDLQELTDQLDAISFVKSSLLTYNCCRDEIEEEYRKIAQLDSFLDHCTSLGASLEEERKNHAEELRLINQDINALEDLLKNLRSERDAQQRRCLQAVQALQSVREAANTAMSVADIDERFDVLPEEIQITQRNMPSDTTRSQNPLSIFPLQQLLPFFKTPQTYRNLEQPNRMKMFRFIAISSLLFAISDVSEGGLLDGVVDLAQGVVTLPVLLPQIVGSSLEYISDSHIIDDLATSQKLRAILAQKNKTADERINDAKAYLEPIFKKANDGDEKKTAEDLEKADKRLHKLVGNVDFCRTRALESDVSVPIKTSVYSIIDLIAAHDENVSINIGLMDLLKVLDLSDIKKLSSLHEEYKKDNARLKGIDF